MKIEDELSEINSLIKKYLVIYIVNNKISMYQSQLFKTILIKIFNQQLYSTTIAEKELFVFNFHLFLNRVNNLCAQKCLLQFK